MNRPRPALFGAPQASLLAAGAILLVLLTSSACSTASSNSLYFGSIDPPAGQVMRYVGTEPESLDPQIGTGQPEARLYLALFDGLTEYDPKTADVTPSLAERWDVSADRTDWVFHLRHANWSDGTPITAGDFVYTIRRGVAPSLAARNAYMAGDILYAQGYNANSSFARSRQTGAFVMWPGKSGVRLVVPSDPAERDAFLTPEMRRALAGTEPVPIRAEDIGIDAIDEYTLHIRTMQPLPYLPGLLSHQFFRPVPRHAIERYGAGWTKPGHLVSSGAFILESWRPYDRIVMVRNPRYWDAPTVRLDRLTFYSLEDQVTMLNLYKAGEVDAVYNHTVPAAWYDRIHGLRDYLNLPESATEYYVFNTTRRPMNDIRVRRALNAAVDKAALAALKRSARPLTGIVPPGIFPGYTSPPGEPFDVTRARQLLAEAGYRDASGQYDAARFPAGDVDVLYNTNENNRVVAEFIQAQWRQNLGITVRLKNMEFRTFLTTREGLQYQGVARYGWVGDYLDPMTFLDLFATPGGNNATGWFEPAYAQMLKDANLEQEPAKRFAALARAESRLLEMQVVMPLLVQGTNWLKKPYVKGMYANPVTLHPWKYVYIEHDPAKWN